MGKPLRGSKLRARQRSREVAEALQEKQADEVAFVIDRSGDVKQHTKFLQQKVKQEAVDQDVAKVERLLRVHGKKKVKAMAEEGRRKLQQQKRTRRGAVQTSPVFSMWGDDGNEDLKKSGTKLTEEREPIVAGIAPVAPDCKARPAPHPDPLPQKRSQLPALGPREAPTGQSYRPESTAHKEIISKAAAVEIERNKALQYDKTPVAQGMRPETRALLLDSSDEESSSDEDDDEPSDPTLLHTKRVQPRTRAERNKQRRLRQQHREWQAQRQAKDLRKQLGRIDEFMGQMKQKAKQEKKKSTSHKKKRSHMSMTKNPRNVPSVAVALEPAASLRTLKPTGLLVAESAMPKQVTKRRKLSYKGHRNRVGEITPKLHVLG